MAEPWLIYFLAFGAVFVAVQFAYSLLSRDINVRRRVNRRLADLESGKYQPAASEDIRRRTRAESRVLGPSRMLDRLYTQAGGSRATRTLITVSVVFFVLVFVALTVFRFSVFAAFLGALVSSLVVLLLVLRTLRARRIRKMSEQLPEVLEIIVRSLRAGHPLTVSLALVAREMPDPAGSEFGITSDEIAYGRDVPAALENLYDRVGYDDLRFVATAITVQHQTGGNLAEILGRLATLIRERFRMRRKVRSLSSEGRMSARVLSVFPLFLAAIIHYLSPDYFGSVWSHPVFELALYLCAALLVVGNLIMYRMVNFRI